MSSADAVALQALLDAGGGQLDGRTYYVDTTLTASAQAQLLGRPGTRIEATAAVDALLVVNAQVRIEDVAFSGSSPAYGSTRYARDGVVFHQGAYSTLKRVAVSNCLRDGVRCEVGNNDGMYVERCDFSGNGTVYTPGGAAAYSTAAFQTKPTLGGASVSGTRILGAYPPWARPGCPVKVGGVLGVTLSVEADGVSLNAAPASPDYSMGVGCGWWEDRSGDNGISTFIGCHFSQNAEVGAAFNGLYGHTVIGCQFDYNSMGGVRVGLLGGNPVLGVTFIRPYFESNGGPSFLLGGVSEVTVQGATMGDPATEYYYITGPALVSGWHLGSDLQGIGSSPQSEVPAKTVGGGSGWATYGLHKFGMAALAIDGTGTLNVKGEVGYLPGGTVTAIAYPGTVSARAAFVGTATPTTFVPGAALVLKGGVARTLGANDTIEFVHTWAGVWVEV